MIEIRHLNKTYRTADKDIVALEDINLTINDGEIFGIIGLSGAGKSTLVRCINLLEQPSAGEVIVDGESITALPRRELLKLRRSIGMIFQGFNLLEQRSVLRNVCFPLEIAGVKKKEAKERAMELLSLVGLADRAEAYPSQLSGGQKQRVAIARALVDRPKVLLLDEPLAALDLKLRQHMLLELDTIHDQVGITFMYVTHDQGEAMSLSDRIAVINRGTIEQLDGPAKIYEAPASRFVASFIGDTNFFSGEIVATEGDYCTIRPKGFPDIRAYNDKQLKVGQKVDLSVRPEKIRVTLAPPPPEKGASINVYPSTVQDIVYQGVYTKYWIKSSDFRIAALKPHSRFLLDQEPITWNDKVFVWWHPDDGYMVEAQQ